MPILSNFPGGSGTSGTGLTLEPVSNIKAYAASGRVYISWTDPADIVLEGRTLAEWCGTLLVRKAGSAPVSRRDGVMVCDITTRDSYSNTYYEDTGLSDGVEYYYKLFPYTTNRVYTESDECLFSIIPTAQVEGINNWKVTSISASTEAGDGKMTVKWTDPSEKIMSDDGKVTLATWKRTTVVVKEGDYATSKDDENIVTSYVLEANRNYYSTNGYTFAGLNNGTTYYVSFFTETTDGGINTSSECTTGVSNRITIPSYPSQSGVLTYTGSEQSPAWDNYDVDMMTLTGTIKGINAGEYVAVFTPKTDYRWTDGTTGEKEITWRINKAAGTLSLSSTAVLLDKDNPAAAITVTRPGDGVITVTSNDTDIATATLNGNVITINHVNETTGETTIVVKIAEGTNYTASSDATIAVSATFISSTLNDNSWEIISEVAKAGTGDNYWDVGDCKAVELNGKVGTVNFSKTTYYVYILGFAHNGATGTIDFGTFKTAAVDGTDICLVGDYYMNDSGSYGGWNGCNLRYEILGSTKTKGANAVVTTATTPVSNTLMAALPSDLRQVMAPMTIWTDNSGGYYHIDSTLEVSSTVDYLPLLGVYEVFSSSFYNGYANTNESSYQKQYPYFTAGNIKKYSHMNPNASYASFWFLRSPSYNTGGGTAFDSQDNTFTSVDSNGNLAYHNGGNVGLSPIFRVGKK